MTAHRIDPGRTRRWTLLVVCGAAFFLLSWHLLYMTKGLAEKSREAAARVTREGREMLGSARYSGFSSPSAGQALLLDAARSRGPKHDLRKVGVVFGRQVIWAVPEGPLPEVQTPPANQDRAYAGEGARWIYAKTLRDGRTVLLVFDLPAFHTAWLRLLALAGLEAVLLLFLLLTMGFQGWRLVSERSRMSDDLAFLREDAPASAGPPGMVRMLQRTLEELRKRTRELEELHLLQKNRAESVEAMVQALCSNLEAGYLRFDEQVKLSGMNAPGRLFLGLPTVPRLGDEAREVLGAFPELARLLDESRETRSVVTREEVPGAEGRLLQAVAIPLFSLANRLQGQLLVLRDMTRLYQMGRTLREQESLSRLGQVAAGVAHEMRNGLNVLSGQLRLLEKDHPELDTETRIGELKEEIGRMEQVVRNLLDYSRPLKLEREELDAWVVGPMVQMA
ncbi:MAG: histidine kinase dimerization/phospho-acceptor domain-containing protein, partial [Acidobacteriota bacterium]